MERFKDNINVILDIAGKEAADIVREIVKIDKENEEIYRKMEKECGAIADLQTRIESSAYLVKCLEKHLLTAEEQVEAENRRIEDQKSMNQTIEMTINNMFIDTENGGWWLWNYKKNYSSKVTM